MEILRQYYETLGVNPGASFEEIKRAYRDSVSVWHPDRFENNPRLKEKSQLKIKEINLAYEKLETFFREYGAPNFENTQGQQSQKTSYKEPPIQPEKPFLSNQNRSNYGLSKAIWNPNVAVAWSILFTPAFGARLLAQNWCTLGETNKASTAFKWQFGINAGIAVNCMMFSIYINAFISDLNEMVIRSLMCLTLLNLIFSTAWYFISVRSQVGYIVGRYGSNYQKKSFVNAVFGGAAVFITLFCVLSVFYRSTLAYSRNNSAISEYTIVQNKKSEQNNNNTIPKSAVASNMYPLEPFITQIYNGQELCSLKIKMELEMTDGSRGDLDARLVPIRDVILSLLSSKTLQDIGDLQGKKQFKEEIVSAVNNIISPSKIGNVYFSDLAIQ